MRAAEGKERGSKELRGGPTFFLTIVKKKQMSEATSLCSARARCHRCYVLRATRRQRTSREYAVLLKLLESGCELGGHKVADLFETWDCDSEGSILFTLPNNGREIRMKDMLSCISAGGHSNDEHQGASCALFANDGFKRGAGPHVLADRVSITAS